MRNLAYLAALLVGCGSSKSVAPKSVSTTPLATSLPPGMGPNEAAFLDCMRRGARADDDSFGIATRDRKIVILTFLCLFGLPASGATPAELAAFMMRYEPQNMTGDFRLIMIRQIARRWGVDFESDERAVVFSASALKPLYRDADGVVFMREGDHVIMRFFRVLSPSPAPPPFSPPFPRPIRFGRGALSEYADRVV